MIEVFKTNVTNMQQALLLIAHISQTFAWYKASFDLEDCDRILRIESEAESVQSCLIINLLNQSGFDAEILDDETHAAVQTLLHNTKYYPVPE